MSGERTDRVVANVGEIVVAIDYGEDQFFLEVPARPSIREWVRAQRLVADLGFQLCDFREYEPQATTVSGFVRIELERIACP